MLLFLPQVFIEGKCSVGVTTSHYPDGKPEMFAHCTTVSVSNLFQKRLRLSFVFSCLLFLFLENVFTMKQRFFEQLTSVNVSLGSSWWEKNSCRLFSSFRCMYHDNTSIISSTRLHAHTKTKFSSVSVLNWCEWKVVGIGFTLPSRGTFENCPLVVCRKGKLKFHFG